MVSEEIQQRVTKKVCLACHREFTGIVGACPHDGTVLIPLQQDQFVGTKLADRYFIESVIGHGGMGVVYKARHELMDRTVAIKMLLSQLISDSLSVKRFQQEAKAASRLKHPNVITLYDFGVSPSGQPYLVMDYLQGVSLADVIKKDGHVGVDRSIKIFKQACSALQHAHQQGVIHRDLKPGNIMLIETEDEKDFVKVVDFGVAKLMAGEDEAQRLTQTGEVCGSPVYMSPEQCMGQKLDARSDVYSMGVVIYEALTGRLPLLGKSMVETMSKHISEMPPAFNAVRPDLYIPERLETVVFRALAKNPDDRLQSMEALEQELEFAVPRPAKSASLRGTLPPATVSPLAGTPASKPAGLPRSAIIAGAVILLVAGGGLAYALLSRPAPKAPAAPAPAPVPAAPAPVKQAPAPVKERVPPSAVRPVAPRPAAEPAAVTPEQAEPATTEPASTEPAAAPETVQPPPRPRRRANTSWTPPPEPARPARRTRPPSAPARVQPAPPAPASDPFQSLRSERSY